MTTSQWRVRHPGIGVLTYGSEAEARVAAGTAGEVLPPVTLRARSCPTCHSIGVPRYWAEEAGKWVDVPPQTNISDKRCADAWHTVEATEPEEPWETASVPAEPGTGQETAGPRCWSCGGTGMLCPPGHLCMPSDGGSTVCGCPGAIPCDKCRPQEAYAEVIRRLRMATADLSRVTQERDEARRGHIDCGHDLEHIERQARLVEQLTAGRATWKAKAAEMEADRDRLREDWEYRGHQLDDAATVGRALIAERDRLAETTEETLRRLCVLAGYESDAYDEGEQGLGPKVTMADALDDIQERISLLQGALKLADQNWRTRKAENEQLAAELAEIRAAITGGLPNFELDALTLAQPAAIAEFIRAWQAASTVKTEAYSRLADTVRRYQPVIDAAKAWRAATRASEVFRLEASLETATTMADLSTAVDALDASPGDGEPLSGILPLTVRGDGPCQDCGTEDNIVWFTESVFWNDIVRRHGDDKILCIPCFVARVDAVGYHPTGWRLLPDWHWETKDERAKRRSLEPAGTETGDADGR